MSSGVTSDVSPEPPAHPLAIALASDLTPEADTARVLLLGIGSGRNVAPFVAARLAIDVLEADPARARDAAIRFAATPRLRVTRARYDGPCAFSSGFAGALSTHALLHGRIAGIERAVTAIANRLAAGGRLYATFGSARDPRFAAGAPVEPFVSAPREGGERGIAHAYFDERRLRTLLDAFEIDALEEGSAAETAGRWAHDAVEASELVHWFVRARKR